MKTTKTILAVLFLALVFSCGGDDDDDTTPSVPQNGITIAGNFTPTPNAYLILDRGVSPFENSFFFALSDGTLINDSNDSVLSSLNTAAALHIDNTGSVSALNQVDVNTNNYILESDDTAILKNISMFTNTIIYNGVSYGVIDQDSATNYLIENSGSGSFTITAITKDFVARNGTITCSFTITDDNGDVITGTYSGTFIILNGDV